ncbi:MAG: hypothetical protein J0I43_09775 [Microbacterium sp.]|uniref:hypothetical protein n=1 Tax=Microbacterium sp. TaxID=51671 RepID=UPI001AD33374|nr:hypothetical protein [Microbacterium sp.]MBN9177640.1 hypothetical protein [Microbacterium sp.]
MTATKNDPRVPFLAIEFRGVSVVASITSVVALTGMAFVLGMLLPMGRLELPALLFAVFGTFAIAVFVRATVLRWRGLRRRADRVQVREGYLSTILFTEVLITSGATASKHRAGIIALTPQELLLLDGTGTNQLIRPIPKASLVQIRRIDRALRAAVPTLSVEWESGSIDLALPSQSGVSLGSITELEVDSLVAGLNAWKRHGLLGGGAQCSNPLKRLAEP